MQKFHLHLVSDSTGETLVNISKAVLSQFPESEAIEHIWSLTRTKSQMEKVLVAIKENPGIVMHTIRDHVLVEMVENAASRLQVPCISALDHIITRVGSYLGMAANRQSGKQHQLDQNYFKRIEAINYTLAHDDGQITHDLDQADIILVGVSRSSKTPTSVYLANRGYKVANIPFVPGVIFPQELLQNKSALVIGLTINPDRLVQIRKNRLLYVRDKNEHGYIDGFSIEEELKEAKRIFTQNHWLVIDVTKRSVEETAATIIQYYSKFKEANLKKERGE